MSEFTQDPIQEFEALQKQMAPLTQFIEEFIAKTPALAGLELDGMAFKKAEPAASRNKTLTADNATAQAGGTIMMVVCRDGNGELYWKPSYPC